MKRTKVLLCILVFILYLSACGYKNKDYVSELEGLSIYTDELSYRSNVKAIKVLWKNESSYMLYFDTTRLDKKIGEVWENVWAPTAVAMIAIPLPPNSQKKSDLDIRNLLNTNILDTGTYRIVTNFWLGFVSNDIRYSVSIEFYCVR